MIDDVNGRRLARYLAGDCLPDEADEVRAWIAADPARGQMADEFARVWQVTRAVPVVEDPKPEEAAWREFVVAREARHVRPLYGPESRRGPTVPAVRWAGRRSGSVWWLGAAAAIVLMALVGALWRFTAHGPAGGPGRAAVSVDLVRVYATRRGERAEFRLPDGSRVHLGVDSRLWVPTDFGSAVRAVHLLGEAYFEVVHDTTRPFLVHAGGTVTEDLGTRFGVCAYAGDPIRVLVAEGAVAVRDTLSHASVVLGPRELALVGSDGKVAVERDVDLDVYLGWTAGRLVFQYSMFADVVKELERRFDVRVTVQDSTLLTARVTATFDDGSLDDILSVLARTLDARIQRRDSAILVRRRN